MGAKSQKIGNSLLCIYFIEYKELNSDWNSDKISKIMKDNKIKLDGLTKNTNYMIRCRYNYDQYTNYSDVIFVKTKKWIPWKIQRGDIVEADWKYNSTYPMAALSLSVNNSVKFIGIGIFNTQGKIKAKYEVCRGDRTITSTETKTFICGKKSSAPIPFYLDSPILLNIKGY